MENLSHGKRKWYETTSAMLHILAMLFMLSDHAWATFFSSGYDWMTCIGRIAFPIFAFMTAEGYFRTSSLKKYMGRMLLFAVLSEIPFNLMYNCTVFYPYHQNVIWTFLIALSGMWLMDRAREKFKAWASIPLCALTVAVCTLLGFAAFTDYYGTGVLTVFVFYFFRERKWWCYIGQLVGMYWINIQLLGGYYYPVKIFGYELELMQQGLALLALIPIWLYNGRQGHHSKAFQYFCYAFYPVHMLILFILSLFIQA